jgi:hypothetical protein
MYTRKKSVLKRTSAMWWSTHPYDESEKYWIDTTETSAAAIIPTFSFAIVFPSRNITGIMTAAMRGPTHPEA